MVLNTSYFSRQRRHYQPYQSRDKLDIGFEECRKVRLGHLKVTKGRRSTIKLKKTTNYVWGFYLEATSQTFLASLIFGLRILQCRIVQFTFRGHILNRLSLSFFVNFWIPMDPTIAVCQWHNGVGLRTGDLAGDFPTFVLWNASRKCCFISLYNSGENDFWRGLREQWSSETFSISLFLWYLSPSKLISAFLHLKAFIPRQGDINRTKLTFQLDFTGNLWMAAFAILAIFILVLFMVVRWCFLQYWWY